MSEKLFLSATCFNQRTSWVLLTWLPRLIPFQNVNCRCWQPMRILKWFTIKYLNIQRVLYPNPDHYSLRNLESTNQPDLSRERISCTLSFEIPKLSFSGTTTQYITRHHLSVCPDCIVYISGCIEVKLSDAADYMQRVRIKV